MFFKKAKSYKKQIKRIKMNRVFVVELLTVLNVRAKNVIITFHDFLDKVVSTVRQCSGATVILFSSFVLL